MGFLLSQVESALLGIDYLEFSEGRSEVILHDSTIVYALHSTLVYVLLYVYMLHSAPWVTLCSSLYSAICIDYMLLCVYSALSRIDILLYVYTLLYVFTLHSALSILYIVFCVYSALCIDSTFCSLYTLQSALCILTLFTL